MTMLSKLEDAIKELEKQKDELLEKIQESGWSDDRSHEKIPEHREFNPDMEEAFEAMKGRIIPEKSRLPPTIRQIYQQWYSAARAIINRNQPERLSEFDDAYSSIKTPTKRDILDELSLSEARIKDILKNRHLSKAIAQQGLFEFKTMIQYKSNKYGIEFVEVDKWYPSSKTCSECGHLKIKLLLSERVFECECCGAIIDRDKNASINLSRYKAS